MSLCCWLDFGLFLVLGLIRDMAGVGGAVSSQRCSHLLAHVTGCPTFGMRFADCVWCGLGLQASGLERNFLLSILDECILLGCPNLTFGFWFSG